MSSATSVDTVLAGYAAGRVTAQQLVEVVATAYYGERGAGSRQRLQPLIEIIERAHPGIVDLSSREAKPGFGLRLAERPFPKRYEAALRQAAAAAVTAPRSPLPAPGLFTRIVNAIRRVFNA